MGRPKATPARPPSPKPELRLKIRLGENILGPGKLRLLELIAETGSISGAARGLGVSYRRAQFLLETLQAGFADPLVITKRGGGGKGGATLTATGQDLVARHRQFQTDLQTQAAPFLAWLAAARPDKP